MRMAPRHSGSLNFPIGQEKNAKQAGVLILLFPNHGDLHFFLTRRTDTVENHKGQISLPGGANSPGESLQETALREICEELGVPESGIEMLGEPLTPLYIPVSGFCATPFVGYINERPEVLLAPDEVVEVIEPSLDWILDDSNICEEPREIRGQQAIVPYFAIDGHKVWGATAAILSEFREILRAAKRVS
jgi:8-oxo-dGTP pyrophosphatase MutT (NUDIX family)